MGKYVPGGFGWQRDLPDLRDYWPEHEKVVALLAGLRQVELRRGGRQPKVVLDEYFPPVEDQLTLAAATAHACAGLAQYFDRRAHGRALDGSHLFLFQMARQLLHGTGDSGGTLRATLKALKRFGLPPREHWPYVPARSGDELPAFLFSYAREYHEVVYLRLDRRPLEGPHILAAVKAWVAAGFPVVFGFTVFDSLQADPAVPFPTCFDCPLGGQAVVATGYDDTMRISSEKGALRFRSSWGREWGDEGFGWLPYRYVVEHLAADFWIMLRPDWLATGEFLAPA